MPAPSPSSRLREILSLDRVSFGTWLQLPGADTAEILAAGFEWVAADLEHGNLDRRDLVDVARAIQGRGSIPLARIMHCNSYLGRQALDSGCVGLIVPHVDDADEFTKFAESCIWPPQGSRSIGFFRANEYGNAFVDYAQSNARPVLIPMIESAAGLQSIDSILATGFADAVLVGPYDLSASIGAVGCFDDPRYVRSERAVLEACSKHKIPAGIHIVSPTPESIGEAVNKGFKFIACGTDTVFLSEAVNATSGFARLWRDHHA